MKIQKHYRLNINDCISMAMNTNNIHLRTYWTNTAKAMLDAAPAHAPRDMGLTIPTGGLYHQQTWQNNAARFERTRHSGVAL